jgi:hypothetical protein
MAVSSSAKKVSRAFDSNLHWQFDSINDRAAFGRQLPSALGKAISPSTSWLSADLPIN